MSIGSQLRSILRVDPYRYQVRGVRFVERNLGRVLIGDDMGLGKTLQAAGWFAVHPEIRPVVVVCPASLKLNWQRELRKLFGLDSVVLNGRRPKHVSSPFLIVNYDILNSWLGVLLETKPAGLVIDECHKAKNRKAKRTKACRRLAKASQHVIALSGTPVLNKPSELYPVLEMIRPREFKSFWRFAFRYCDPKKGFGGHWDFSGSSNLEELQDRLQGIMIRRTKREVLPHLPPKRRITIPVEIDNQAEYTKAQDDIVNWIREQGGEKAVKKAKGAIALVRLGKLKHLAAVGKLRMAARLINDWIDATEDKLLIFGIHTDVLDHVYSVFRKISVKVDGSVRTDQRMRLVDRFQTDPDCRIFLGQLQAAGHGLNLTAASTILFLEIGWVPADHDQAEDRSLRIGQTADSVDCYYLVGSNTIEERIMEIQEKKREVCDQILGPSQSYLDLLR